MQKIEVKVPDCSFFDGKFKELVSIDFQTGRLKFKVDKNTIADVDFKIYPSVFFRLQDVGLFDDIE